MSLSAVSVPTLSDEEHADQVAEAIALDTGLKRLLKMVGVKSLKRQMRDEDAAVDRDTRQNERAMWGGNMPNASQPADEDDATEMMAARDVAITHHHYPQQAPAKNGMSTAAKAGIVALAALAGGGVTAAAMQFLKRPAAQTQYDFGLLPPDEPNKVKPQPGGGAGE